MTNGLGCCAKTDAASSLLNRRDPQGPDGVKPGPRSPSATLPASPSASEFDRSLRDVSVVPKAEVSLLAIICAAKFILCDVSGMALLSRIPSEREYGSNAVFWRN